MNINKQLAEIKEFRKEHKDYISSSHNYFIDDYVKIIPHILNKYGKKYDISTIFYPSELISTELIAEVTITNY